MRQGGYGVVRVLLGKWKTGRVLSDKSAAAIG